MIVWKQQYGEWVKGEKLYEALSVDFARKQVISAVGGGGKTTALYRLAEELSALGKKVILTTSTHMAMPEIPDMLISGMNDIKKIWKNHTYAVVGRSDGNRKMTGVTAAEFDAMCEYADLILVEADGSRQLPVKMPAMHEPSIPISTTHILVFAGMNALGQELGKACHRPELVMQQLRAGEDHIMSPEDVAVILNQGYWIPFVEEAGRTGTILLNQADDDARFAGAGKAAALLSPIPCLITRLNEDNIRK